MKVWAHTLVCNEERYLWYAVTSVIDYVDRILLWDTGSEDKTVAVIKKIRKDYPNKIDFQEMGKVTPEEFTQVRQEMLKKTLSDWFLIVDGDEVWFDKSISKTRKVLEERGKELESVISKYYNIVGDIYHYQEEAAGMYRIDNLKGHINIRALNMRISGLHFAKPHGQQGLFDAQGKLIQKRNPKQRIFIEEPAYLHFTNVVRSSLRKHDLKVPKRKSKLKYDLGVPFPLDFFYPEAFFKPKPALVTSAWSKRNFNFELTSLLQQPARFIKRRVKFLEKSGY